MVALVLAAAAICVFSPALVNADAEVGDRASEFVNAKDERGRRVKLRSYRNKIVVVTFGASWCKPCKKELPAWESLAKRYQNKNVVFLAFNIDQDLGKGKEFMKKASLSAMRAVYEQDGSTVQSYSPPTMPSTYVIDKRGIIRHLHAGYRSGDEKKLAAELDQLLSR